MANTKKTDIPESLWNVIKTDYVTAETTSYRQLEKKYGISYNKLQKRAAAEDWQSERNKFKSNRSNKSLELVAEYQAQNCAKAFGIANKAIDKLSECIDLISPKDREAAKKLKSITSAIKDLNEIGVFRSDMDIKEQEARIKKLQKAAEEEEKDRTITVVIDEELQKYSK